MPRELRTGRWLSLCLILAAVFPARLSAEEPKLPPAVDRTVDYDQDIRPIFAKHCDSCHGGEKQLSGFRLDREGDALRGGDSGKAFEPGRSADSLLVRYIAGLDPDILMPPEGDLLTAAQIGLVRGWIDQGAKWGRINAETKASSGNHWSFQPVRRPAPPVVKGEAWIRNPIDRFVLARLEAEQVEPSPPADRPTLIRRLSLDLLGLPPQPARVAEFVADTRSNAYELLVEELLRSPHFGERWGRHWLDLARYADSDGYEKDSPRPNAWRYRDWVIQALNRDLPFNQFSIEQLAGDLLPGSTIQQQIATGFHRNTLTNREGGVDAEEFRVAAVVDRVNTTATVWLGLTLGCAQCHSHKYDPLSLREYYGMFAFFNQGDETDLAAPPADTPGAVAPTIREADPRRATHVLLRGDFLRRGDEVPPHTPEVLPPLDVDRAAVPSRLDLARWLVHPRNPLTPRVTVNRVWRQLFGQGVVASVEDFGSRGEAPSHPELLDWLAAELMLPTLELAPPPRPGEPAVFRGPWSLKRLLKIITCSATYRQQSAPRPELESRDPRNIWLARQNRLRVEAEIVRDQALFVSGLLHPAIGGPSVRPPQPAGIAELTYAGSSRWVESTGVDRYRRGMYTWFQRTSPHPMLVTFDAPESNVSCTRRERSNTPLQSLTLLNDPVFFECAQALGWRVYREADPTAGSRIDRLYQLCLGRHPTESESRIAAELAGRLDAAIARQSADVDALIGVEPGSRSPAGAGGATKEGPAPGDTQPPNAPLAADQKLGVASCIALARVMLNLDEFVMRE